MKLLNKLLPIGAVALSAIAPTTIVSCSCNNVKTINLSWNEGGEGHFASDKINLKKDTKYHLTCNLDEGTLRHDDMCIGVVDNLSVGEGAEYTKGCHIDVSKITIQNGKRTLIKGETIEESEYVLYTKDEDDVVFVYPGEKEIPDEEFVGQFDMYFTVNKDFDNVYLLFDGE